MILLDFTCICLVAAPVVNVSVSDNQKVGQSLTLQCEVTTVRGITSRVDIVWSSGSMELERTNDVSSTTLDNSLVYNLMEGDEGCILVM